KQLHNKARHAIAAGENKLREAAEHLAAAKKLGATVRESATAVGKSKSWVSALLQWRERGYERDCPFPRATRRSVQPAGQQKTKPSTAEQTARYEAQRTRAEAAVALFAPPITIPEHSRLLLIEALRALASAKPAERADAALAVEKRRALLNMDWDQLLV